MINPFTNSEYSETAQKLRTTQKVKFPTADPLILKEFDTKYCDNDVIIVKAATGTGKGVVLAPRAMFLENVKPVTKATGLDRFDGGTLLPSSRVIITEPRTPNTLVAKFLKQVLDAPAIVNYSFRFDNNLSESTLLAFVTDGFLLNFFYNDITLPKYNCVIIDEVHERNKNIDQLLCFLKLTGKKTVILSATIDIDEYTKYFESPIIDAPLLANVLPISPKVRQPRITSMTVEGSTYEVKDIFLTTEEDYIEQAVKLVKQICENTDTSSQGDILIFLAAAPELAKACKKIYKLGLQVACMELHRSTQDSVKEVIIDEHQYKNMKFNGHIPSRKVVFSTNVAESGITVNGIIHVIDSGRRYESTFNASEEMYELKNRYISRAEAEQRRGRVGRTQPGTCYHLYTQEEYNTQFPAFKSPEILTEEISDIVLSLLNSNITEGRLDRTCAVLINMISPPLPAQISFATRLLKQLGLIDSNAVLTKLGVEVSKASLGLCEGITYIAGKSFKIEHQICQIMAMMSIGPQFKDWVFPEPYDTREKNEYLRRTAKWKSARGEIFILRAMFNEFKNHPTREWCDKNYLYFTKFERATKQYYKLRDTIKKILPLFEEIDGSDDDKIIEAFKLGYPLNKAVRSEGRGSSYKIDRPVEKIDIECPPMLTKLSKVILYLDIGKVASGVSVTGIINL